MFEIVPFLEEHVEPSLVIYNHYILHSTATFSVEPLKAEEFRKLAFTGLDRFKSFAMLEDGVVVGYGLLNRYKPREAYDRTAEITVYLDKDHHGKGYGKRCVEYLEAFAKEKEFRALLAVICAENKPSIKLFQTFDYFECAHFREVGEKFGRVLDVVIYEKLL